eukprot:2785262-Amphidinium_carterae.1
MLISPWSGTPSAHSPLNFEIALKSQLQAPGVRQMKLAKKTTLFWPNGQGEEADDCEQAYDGREEQRRSARRLQRPQKRQHCSLGGGGSQSDPHHVYTSSFQSGKRAQVTLSEGSWVWKCFLGFDLAEAAEGSLWGSSSTFPVEIKFEGGVDSPIVWFVQQRGCSLLTSSDTGSLPANAPLPNDHLVVPTTHGLKEQSLHPCKP